MTPFLNDHPDRIIDVTPYGGADVRHCIWQAEEIVRVLGGSVRFTHNGVSLIVDGKRPYAEIYKQWHDGLTRVQE